MAIVSLGACQEQPQAPRLSLTTKLTHREPRSREWSAAAGVRRASITVSFHLVFAFAPTFGELSHRNHLQHIVLYHSHLSKNIHVENE